MFASIRCYVLQSAPLDEVTRLVEDEFADRIAAQPGFVWYFLLDRGDGALMTISVFHERELAARSRELSRSWTEERLGGFDLTLTETMNGAIPVSRATPQLLEPSPGRVARVRRYKIADADLGEIVWRLVDTRLAERIAQLDGFVGYFVFSSGEGELVSVSVFADRASAASSDEVALVFVRDELGDLEIERTDSIGDGEIVVSRVTGAFLEPRHG